MSGRSIPILNHLRAVTRPIHDRLEALTHGNRIMNGTLTPDEYLHLIDWQSRAHLTLEHQVVGFVGGDYQYRSRFPVIGMAQPRPELPESIGMLYVLEGSSLGGSLIYRKLTENPGVEQYAPFDFYRDQAAWGLQQWKSFVAFLQTVNLTEAEITRAGDSAVAAFNVFESAWQ